MATKRRKFKVVFQVEVDVEVDDDVVQDALSDDFKASFYKLGDAAGVAQHLAYNFVANRAKLSSLDGFAHWGDDKGKLKGEDWDFVESTES
jgi:hypothetical protein